MDRSLRESTAKKRERSAELHQGHLLVKLWHASRKGRLDEVLSRLEAHEYNANYLGSIMLEFIFRRSFPDMRRNVNADVMRVVKSFVCHGANMHAVDICGTDMVSTAMWSRDTDLTRYILNWFINNTTFGIDHHDTTRWHRPRLFDATTAEMAKLILEYGADMSKRGPDNSPLLQFQANQTYSRYPGYPDGGQFRLIQFLVEELKCDTNGCDQNGKTALHSSVGFFGETDIIQLLLDHGADVHAVDNSGRTPLFPAVQSGNLDLIQLLCENGADISKRDEDELSSLDVATRIAGAARSFQDRQRSYLVLNYLDEELTRRERTAAVSMGYHHRLGEFSPLQEIEPDLLRYILEKADLVNEI
jgi:hypothetical protein